MRKLSSFFPPLIAAVSHLGRLPRPAAAGCEGGNDDSAGRLIKSGMHKAALRESCAGLPHF
jgi:hypothetical protein